MWFGSWWWCLGEEVFVVLCVCCLFVWFVCICSVEGVGSLGLLYIYVNFVWEVGKLYFVFCILFVVCLLVFMCVGLFFVFCVFCVFWVGFFGYLVSCLFCMILRSFGVLVGFLGRSFSFSEFLNRLCNYYFWEV